MFIEFKTSMENMMARVKALMQSTEGLGIKNGSSNIIGRPTDPTNLMRVQI